MAVSRRIAAINSRSMQYNTNVKSIIADIDPLIKGFGHPKRDIREIHPGRVGVFDIFLFWFSGWYAHLFYQLRGGVGILRTHAKCEL